MTKLSFFTLFTCLFCLLSTAQAEKYSTGYSGASGSRTYSTGSGGGGGGASTFFNGGVSSVFGIRNFLDSGNNGPIGVKDRSTEQMLDQTNIQGADRMFQYREKLMQEGRRISGFRPTRR